MAKKAIVSGGGGFVGTYLVELLTKEGMDVGIIDYKRGHDITNLAMMEQIITVDKPDYFFHLAAAAFVPTSFADPTGVLDVNVRGTHNILEAIRRHSPSTKVMFCGSSEEYGLVKPEECPITERNELRPQSVYAWTKMAGDYESYVYNQTWGLHVVRTRAFNHTGPGRGVDYAESNFAKQIIEIERKERGYLQHGNLDAKRDYTDVRDMVRAYRLAIDLKPDVYNIASGTARTMREVIATLKSFSKLEDVPLEKDPTRMRPSDVPLLLGDSTKFRRLTGWKPEIPFEKTMQDLLSYWRDR